MSDTRAQEAPAPGDRSGFYSNEAGSIPLMRGPEDMPQPDTLDLIASGFTAGQARNTNAERERLKEAYRPILELLNEGRQRRIWRPQDHPDRAFDNPGEWAPQAEGGGGVREGEEARIWAEIARRSPAWRKQHGLPETIDAFHDQVTARAAEKVAQADAVIARNRTWGGTGARLLGGAAAGMTDPITVATLPVGGAGRTVATRILTEGLANAGMAAATLPITARRSAEIGQPMTAADAALEVGGAFALGAGVQGVVIEPLGAVAKRVIGHERMTDAERAAVDLIEREDHAAAISPFQPGAGTEAHLARLDAAMAALNTPPEMSAKARLASGTSLGSAPAPAPRMAPAPAARETFMARVRGAESSGDDAARNPRSSAAGRYQFTDGTWLRYHKRVVGGVMSDAQRLAQKPDGAVQDRLMTALTADNAAALARIGAPETAGNLYLMHFAGQGGARKILQAAPDAPVERLLNADAIAANPFLRGKTAEDVIEWAHRRMGEEGHAGPLVRRDQFADDAEGDAEWAAAQREVDAAEAEMRRLDDAGQTSADMRGPAEMDRVASPRSGESEMADVSAPRDLIGQDWEPGDVVAEAAAPPPKGDVPRMAGEVDPQRFAARPANAPADAVSDILLGPIFVAPKGKPGFSIEDKAGDGHELASVFRDEKGNPKGVLVFPATAEAREPVPGYSNSRVTVYVDPAYRRQGIASRLYDQLRDEGFDVDDLMGSDDLTPDGAAFTNARKQRLAGEPAQTAEDVATQAAAPAPLAHFDDPYAGPGVTTATDSLEHDIRMLADAEPDRIVQLGDGEPQRLDDVLRELDEDEAAIAAARACMVPAGAAS